jgi:hypothetical protein
MCARIGNQQSHCVVTAWVQTNTVRSLHHQRWNLHQSTYPVHLGISGLILLSEFVDGFDSFITFTDDYSRYGNIYPIKHQSKSLDKYKIFKAEVENQHNL